MARVSSIASVGSKERLERAEVTRSLRGRRYRVHIMAGVSRKARKLASARLIAADLAGGLVGCCCNRNIVACRGFYARCLSCIRLVGAIVAFGLRGRARCVDEVASVSI